MNFLNKYEDEEELVDAVPPVDNYESENINNVFRYTEQNLEPEEFSYLEFFGVEDIEEFEKSGDIWG